MRPTARLSTPEFVALMAMLVATVAFSLDAMLPAMTVIADELSPEAPNRAQLVITSFVLGMGIGTLFTGPLSDAYGRRPVLVAGAILYIVGAALAWISSSLEVMLAARVIQGLGAAGPRVVALAIVRDLYQGRAMARIMSFIMLVFTLVPAIAPTLGYGIIWSIGWRGIFLAFSLFAVIGVAWLMLRQPETLPPDRRRPFRPRNLADGVREIVTTRLVAYAIAAQSVAFGALFANLSSTQMVFDRTFGEGERFHLWFGLIAILAASGSVINAALVERLGMRFIVTATFGAQIIFSGFVALLFLAVPMSSSWGLAVFVVWTVGVFFQAGLTIGNLNALAMEPMGHLAGLTASVVGSLATVAAVAMAAPIGLAYDGTPVPLVLGTAVLAIAGWALMRPIRRLELSGASGVSR